MELLSLLEALPGVQAASLYGFGLLSGNGWSDRVLTEGYVAKPGEELTCQGMWVGPKFFETLGIKILSGRDFTRQDDRTTGVTNTTTEVAVINEAMVRRYFGDAMPLSRRFYFPGRPGRGSECGGWGRAANYHPQPREAPPRFDLPFFQDSGQGMTVA